MPVLNLLRMKRESSTGAARSILPTRAEPIARGDDTERYQFSYGRLTRSSLIGALIALVFDFVVTFLTSSQDVFSVRRIPA
jgi:hypothetical protein